MSIIDLFAGAGGFGLGFELSGQPVALSLEQDAWACDTLRANNEGRTIIQADIRDFVDPATITTVAGADVDVIIGGPPCQGFSIAGPARKDPSDPRNSLFKDFARWVAVLQPRVLIMENVKGLLSRKNSDGQRVIKIIGDTFNDYGYNVEIWTLNAAEYGVPQIRERIFIVGHALNHPIGPPAPTHRLGEYASTDSLTFNYEIADGLLPAVTLWEAISDLPALDAGEGYEHQPYQSQPNSIYQEWIRQDSQCLFNHVAMRHSKRLVDRFRHIGCGESSADVPELHGPRSRNGNGALSGTIYDQNNRRMHPFQPCHTIAASFYANFLHPYQHRNFTAREGARVQSFTDKYKFMGKKTVVSHKLLGREQRHDEQYLCQYNQIGNAVPPILARAVATHIREAILDVVA